VVWDDVLAAGGVPSDPESDFHRLYSGDGSHPSPYGSFLVAAVFHAALTGHEPQGNGVLEATLDDVRYRTYLETVAARAVLDSPYAFPLPWALDIEDVSDTVSDPGLRLLVRVAAPAERDALSLGVEHDDELGYGRLWVASGGALEVSDLTVGAGGDGVLEVTGGMLNVVTAATRGSGAVVLSGGATTVQSGVLPPVTQTGGTLGGAFDIDGDLTQSGGTLVAVDGGRVAVAGAASVGGALDVTGVRAEEQVVLTASVLVDEGLEWVARADQVVTVDADAGTITVRSEGTVTDTGSPATTPGTSDDMPPSSGDTGSTYGTMDSAGDVCKESCGRCGCSAGGGTGGGWAIILACAFGLRRRRQALA
jgi:MYXO-CTERM domain-containing protein